MIPKYYSRSVLSLLLIPLAAVLGGGIFEAIGPELARGHGDYARNFALLGYLRSGVWLATLLALGVLWLLACIWLVRAKSLRTGWLLLTLLGPPGFALLTALSDRSPLAPGDVYGRLLLRLPPLAAGPSTDSPAQFAPFGGGPLLRVLRTNPLNRVRADPLKVLRCPCRQRAQIEAREPFTLRVGARRRQPRGFIAEVERLVHLYRGRAQPSVGFGTDLQSQSARERGRHERIIYSHRRSCSTSFAQLAGGSQRPCCSVAVDRLQERLHKRRVHGDPTHEFV